MTRRDTGQNIFVREGGRWLATPLFLVVIVIETTDLVFAADSIPAVFGVTRDPFLVYSSNVCAILGLRAFYFLLAGILPYFQYLDEGLAVVLMFIGGKMLAEPWVHISTGVSLAMVGTILVLAVLMSLIRAAKGPPIAGSIPQDQIVSAQTREELNRGPITSPTSEYIRHLADPNPEQRAQAAHYLFNAGKGRILDWLDDWQKDEHFRVLIVHEYCARPDGQKMSFPRLTVGIAVVPENFDNIRAANGSPALADAPPDQDVIEFELEFAGDSLPSRLDILTTKSPGGDGAIARFLEKLGEGIQQIEIDVTDVDRATEILRAQFKLDPIYPARRPGANGTRVNFFLITIASGKKVLIELVEQPKVTS